MGCAPVRAPHRWGVVVVACGQAVSRSALEMLCSRHSSFLWRAVQLARRGEPHLGVSELIEEASEHIEEAEAAQAHGLQPPS